MIKATEKQLASAFERWLRQYKRNPSKFAKEFGKAASYGKACASHLKQLLAMACIAVAVVVQSGCATSGSVANAPGGATNDSAAIVLGLIEDAALVGTQEALIEKPEWRDRFETARAELDGAIVSGRFDAATFRLIVNRLPIKELKSPAARIGINFATMQFYRHGARVGIDQPEWVKSGMVAVRNGIAGGLAFTKGASAPATAPPARGKPYHWSWFHKAV